MIKIYVNSQTEVLMVQIFSLQQATILREDLPGFIFESNRGTKHSFTAETSLGPEFAAGWTGKRGKRLRSKIEAMKQKVLFRVFLNEWVLKSFSLDFFKTVNL